MSLRKQLKRLHTLEKERDHKRSNLGSLFDNFQSVRSSRETELRQLDDQIAELEKKLDSDDGKLFEYFESHYEMND